MDIEIFMAVVCIDDVASLLIRQQYYYIRYIVYLFFRHLIRRLTLWRVTNLYIFCCCVQFCLFVLHPQNHQLKIFVVAQRNLFTSSYVTRLPGFRAIFLSVSNNFVEQIELNEISQPRAANKHSHLQ